MLSALPVHFSAISNAHAQKKICCGRSHYWTMFMICNTVNTEHFEGLQERRNHLIIMETCISKCDASTKCYLWRSVNALARAFGNVKPGVLGPRL
jgi:hypothetical protein